VNAHAVRKRIRVGELNHRLGDSVRAAPLLGEASWQHLGEQIVEPMEVQRTL